mmetsp:Transcript_22505/g.64735  ORF Transcript_22505/g.64735 Transcript_22505/m.64735 type:complete len:253 (-) Transcript_22505:150-908(-)
MFSQSSSNISIPRGAGRRSVFVDKIGTSSCVSSFPTFDDVMAMDIADDIVGTGAPPSPPNNNSANTANLVVEDSLIDELAFLQESFQVADGGMMVDDEMYFDLFDDDDEVSISATTTARPSTTTRPAKASNCKNGITTVEQIRSLEAKLTKSMQRTNVSRAVIQDGMSSRTELSRSSFVSHASTTSLSSISTTADDSTFPPPSPHATPSITPKRIACTAAFLTGKRSTLTPALEQSRKKLKMYMEQLDMSAY